MKYRNSFLWTGFALVVMFTSSCHSGHASHQSYKQKIDAWHQQRINNLTQADSWLSLAGLYWLDEGNNSFGSDSTNDMVFPTPAPDSVGTFALRDGTVRVSVNPRVLVTNAKKSVKKMELSSDASENPTILHHGSLSWYVIKRGNRYGIRLKDANSKALRNFNGINRFPVSQKWRLEANYQAFDTLREKKIATITGVPDTVEVPGKLVFKMHDRQFSLLPMLEEGRSQKWFIVFGDQTNGKTTYGGGRFLYVQKAGDNQKTLVDFNKAYNPPCAFTDFATCPLPPEENKLPIALKAGEKQYGTHTYHH